MRFSSLFVIDFFIKFLLRVFDVSESVTFSSLVFEKWINGCKVAMTGRAPSKYDLFLSFVMFEPLIRGSLELAFICIYNSIRSFFAMRSAGPLLFFESLICHPLEIRYRAIMNSASLPN